MSDDPRPKLEQVAGATSVVRAVESELGERYLYCDGQASLLFTENETNTQRLFGVPNRTPFVKDGINNYIVHGQRDAVNPQQNGDEGRGSLPADRAAGRAEVVRLRLTPVAPNALSRARQRTRRRSLRQALRRNHEHAPEGSGRVLCVGHSACARADAGQRHAAGIGWHAVVEAVLLFRRERLARGAGP